MQIVVEIKSAYGQENYYPIDENARAFCSIARTKTLTKDMIETIKTLGFKVIAQSQVAGRVVDFEL